jgi:hypothetical protein
MKSAPLPTRRSPRLGRGVHHVSLRPGSGEVFALSVVPQDPGAGLPRRAGQSVNGDCVLWPYPVFDTWSLASLFPQPRALHGLTTSRRSWPLSRSRERGWGEGTRGHEFEPVSPITPILPSSPSLLPQSGKGRARGWFYPCSVIPEFSRQRKYPGPSRTRSRRSAALRPG